MGGLHKNPWIEHQLGKYDAGREILKVVIHVSYVCLAYAVSLKAFLNNFSNNVLQRDM